MLRALARLADRRRRAVLVASAVVLFAAGAYGGPVAGLLDTGDDFSDPQSESIQARDTIERTTGRSSAPDAVVLVRLGARAGTPEADRKLAAVRSRIQDRDVASIGVPEPGRPSPLVSKDRRSVYLPVTFYSAADEDEAADALVARLRGERGVTVGGGIVAFNQVGDQVEADLQRAELLAAPILLLLSLLVFRSLVAALLPLAVGTATVLLTFSGLRAINEIEPMSTFAINLTTGLGLGLSIDYSLFMVSRFREELAAGGDRSRAVQETVRTAGRTVLFSAFTVAAALAAMLTFDLRFLYSMGAGGVLVALSAALVSLTLLPALLAVLGPRVNALGLRRWRVAMQRDAAHVQAGPWYRFSRAVMRRPGPVAASAAVLLIVMGLPFLRIEFTGVDASVLPAEKSAKVVDDALRGEFPPGPTSPVLVVAGVGERGRPAAQDYARRLAALDGVASVSPPEQAGGYWLYDVVPEDPALSGDAQRLVEDVRALDVPFPVQVGGETAGFLDQQTAIGDSLPLALAILATTTLLILFAMTGSVVLPVKALVMNLLTVSAAFGLLVLIFQDGRLEGLLAYDSQGALEATQPVLLFCVAFGLSTDYGVFLLTRIKEARDAGTGERESVAVG
ncbi:MAG TPA: efflux RND transporter permease subunit, partial [Solirubrobacteraceae bacterium]|nr:efflux RND transporter permease subunit [Solirubrobacteraceae bacterium]